MPVTVLAHLTVAEDQPVALAAYFKVTQPLLEAAGGKIVKRFRLTDAIVGQRPLVLVPYITIAEEAAQRRKLLLRALAAAVALGLAGLAAIHFLYMPLDVVVIKLMLRLS